MSILSWTQGVKGREMNMNAHLVGRVTSCLGRSWKGWQVFQSTRSWLVCRINRKVLTDSFAFGVIVMSRIGSQNSAVEKVFVRRFSSNFFGSRKKVTEPMFRCVSLAVSFEIFLFLSVESFDWFRLRLARIFGARSRRIRLPCRLSCLYVPLIPVCDYKWIKFNQQIVLCHYQFCLRQREAPIAR